jgi:hypothetical protein
MLGSLTQRASSGPWIRTLGGRFFPAGRAAALLVRLRLDTAVRSERSEGAEVVTRLSGPRVRWPASGLTYQAYTGRRTALLGACELAASLGGLRHDRVLWRSSRDAELPRVLTREFGLTTRPFTSKASDAGKRAKGVRCGAKQSIATDGARTSWRGDGCFAPGEEGGVASPSSRAR